MKTSLNQRRAALISQMANLTPNHPQYKQDAAELAQIIGSLDGMMADLRSKAAERIQVKLRSDLERTAGVEARLNSQLAQLTAAAGGATSKMQRASDLAIDINRLQNRFTTVDEEWRNLTLEESAPGSAFLSAPATTPTDPAVMGKLRITGLLAFAGLFLGMMAAVTAHKMDPRVYIASDVERVLGYAPMAQLPDFFEVPTGVSEEYMLRLAASIEHARKQGNLKSCIFTGAGPGTGVSTLIGKVRDLLEAMGRPTTLLDATGTAAGFAQDSASELPGTQALVARQRGSRQSALLKQMADESETQREGLVLTDTAPLVLSAETEYLARFVDCAIVVVESGVTTRAQLRDAASTLQRLDVAAVGFVLNRVALEKADRAFRLSVRAIEEHLDAQSGSMAGRAPRRNHPIAEETKTEENIHSRGAAVLLENTAVAAEPVPASAARLKFPATRRTAAPQQRAALIPEPALVPAARQTPPANPETAAPFKAPTAVAQAAASPATPPVPDLTKLSTQNPQRKHWQRAQEATQPITNQNFTTPWWLAELHQKANESRAAANSSQAVGREAQEVTNELRLAGVAANQRPKLPAVQPWDRLPPVRAGAPDSAADWKPEVLAAIADLSAAYKPAAVPGEICGAESEENSTGLATRLSGLRSLLSMLGVKDRQQATEQLVEEVEEARPVDPAIEHAVYAGNIATAAAGAIESGKGAGKTLGLVTAAPEFLPPKSAVEEAENSQPSRFRDRRGREDDFDDVQILPSWRGQYRK